MPYNANAFDKNAMQNAVFLSLRLDFPVNKNIWHIGTSWLQKCMGLAQLLQYFDSIGQWTGSRLTE